MAKITERLYFPYHQLEEYKQGMWRIVRGDDRKRFSEAAANHMRDSGAFEASMRQAIEEWPISCAHNLTAEDSNRLAWLGHAGCLIAVNSCEENTRAGWHMLSADEQREANRVAQLVLDCYESSARAGKQMEIDYA